MVASVPVALGSKVKPPVADSELDGSSSPVPVAELDEVGVASVAESVEVVNTASVLVAVLDSFVLVLPPSELIVVIVMPGHRLWIPSPFWNTPMMLSSPASTFLHLSLTLSAISERPRTQAAVHVAPALKSSGTHPEIDVV